MTTGRPRRQFVVQSLSRAAARGWLSWGPFRVPCALGGAGQRVLKREGDSATPIGRWPLQRALFRPDQLGRPRTRLPTRALRRHDGWCDSPGDRNYNRPVRLPYGASAEEMWRRDGIYDLVVVLGYNDRPRRRGAGSAIFLHLARDGMTPTAGCIALRRADARRLVAHFRPGDLIRIGV